MCPLCSYFNKIYTFVWNPSSLKHWFWIFIEFPFDKVYSKFNNSHTIGTHPWNWPGEYFFCDTCPKTRLGKQFQKPKNHEITSGSSITTDVSLRVFKYMELEVLWFCYFWNTWNYPVLWLCFFLNTWNWQKKI